MIRVGILGAGHMGENHCHNLMKIQDVDIVAVCDIQTEQAKALADTAGATAYTDFDRMLAETEMDALYILLPPFAHSGQFEKAAAKGIHIFIEKPIALRSEVGISMVNAAREAGIKTHVGFHMRYGSAVEKLRGLMQSGQTGRPVLFNGRYQCNNLHSQWWIDENLCGGQIFEQAIHVYDMGRYLLGHPKAVSALMGNLCHADVSGYTVEDVSSSISSFTTGAQAAITATNCSIPGRWDAYFDVTFERLTVNFRSPDEADFHYYTADGVETECFHEPVDHKYAEDAAFMDIIRANNACMCPIEEGLRSLCYVEAALFSAKMDGKKLQVKNY